MSGDDERPHFSRWMRHAWGSLMGQSNLGEPDLAPHLGELDLPRRWNADRAHGLALWISLLALAGWALLMTALVTLMARNLRPIADDYSLGTSAKDGLILGVWHWLQTWSGDITTNFANVLFVGIPLQRLPWSVASAVPFMLSALAAAGIASWLITTTSSVRCTWPRILGIVLPVVACSWWGYWWVAASFSTADVDTQSLARGITFWQNLNSAYVLTTLAIVWAWCFLETRAPGAGRWRWLAYLVLGVMAGTNGPVFAVAAAAMIPLIAWSVLLSGETPSRPRLINWALLELGILAGAALAHFAPGTQLRSSQVPNTAGIGLDLVRSLTHVPQQALDDWWRSLANPGALIVVVTIGSASLLMSRLGMPLSTSMLSRSTFGLLGFSLVLALANRTSEQFAYEGWWHLTPVRTTAWLGCCCLGAYLGARLASLEACSLSIPIAVFASLIAMLVISAALFKMNDEVVGRVLVWDAGPAPVEGISDTEDPSGWKRAAWTAFIDSRGGGPRRGAN